MFWWYVQQHTSRLVAAYDLIFLGLRSWKVDFPTLNSECSVLNWWNVWRSDSSVTQIEFLWNVLSIVLTFTVLLLYGNTLEMSSRL